MINDNPTRMPVLPVNAYTSQEWFDQEQKEIFSKVWAFGGFPEDLPDTGDHLTVQAGLNNIIVIRGKDGELRAFHNICRHRGARMLRPHGKSASAITCPYHDWTYDLEGNLKGIPNKAQEFPDLDTSCLNLHKASVGIWRGMFFVHPDPLAPSVESWFGPMEEYVGPHRPDEMMEIEHTATETEIRANWKFVAENYIDAYHLPLLHSGTLPMYDHRKAETGFVGDHFAFYEPLASDYADNLEKNAPSPLVEFGKNHRVGAYVPLLFPGIGLSETELSWSLFHIVPLAPDRTLVKTRTKFPPATAAAFAKAERRSAGFWRAKVHGKYAGDPETDPMASGDFMLEDVFACEQQQASLSSPYFSVGASADVGEKPVRDYQAIIQRWMSAAN
jgi:Rieske 2Fe-2S family protein